MRRFLRLRSRLPPTTVKGTTEQTSLTAEELQPVDTEFTEEAAPTKHNILNLPNKILLEITRYLEPHERPFLSYTCRRFQTFSQGTVKCRLGDLERYSEMANRYLYQLYKDRPDCWACLECSNVHSVNLSDLPGANQYQYIATYGDEHHQRRQSSNWCRAEHARISQSHVQIAIKLWRLREKCSSIQLHYVQRLMSSYMAIDFTDVTAGMILVSSYTPKMVQSGDRLVYLVHGVTHLTADAGYNLTLQRLPFVNICRHQNLQRIISYNNCTTPRQPQSRNAITAAPALASAAAPARAA